MLLIPQLFSQGYDFVLWVDADATFVRFDLDIRDFVVPGKDLYIVEHTYVYHGRTMTVPNAGVILIRNSNWSMNLIQTLWKLEKYKNHFWHENAALIELLGRQSLLGDGEDVPNPSITEHVAFLPLEWNSLPEYCPAKDPVIIHYAGTPAATRIRELPRAALRGSHSAIVKLHKKSLRTEAT